MGNVTYHIDNVIDFLNLMTSEISVFKGPLVATLFFVLIFWTFSKPEE